MVYDNIKRRAIYNDAGKRLAALRWLTRAASKRRAAEFRALQWAMRSLLQAVAATVIGGIIITLASLYH